jgi:ribosomal protein S18 acetylase RimI-like enzyme
MAGLELMPFAEEHLDEAARLLAARQARHRAAEPLLPSAYEQEDAARAAIEEGWRTEDASGAVAARGGRIVGYLVGAPKTEPLWGRNVWVGTAGHAVEEAETLRDVYAAAAAPWVEAGAARHYAMVPAIDAELVDAWFRVGFGQQQALGIREVPPAAEQPQHVSVRPATTDDVEALLPLDLLGEYQAGPPVFSPTPTPNPDEQRAEIAEEIADERAALVVAELDGRLVGLATAAPVEYSSLHGGLARPEQACVLGYATTLPEVRGSGAGVAVTNGVFDWARDHGYRTVVVDWRVTNLLASRFWPARGFRTTFLRLYRSIP